MSVVSCFFLTHSVVQVVLAGCTPEYMSHLITSVTNVPAQSALLASSSGDLVTSTDWRQGFFFNSFTLLLTVSMEQVADRAEAVDHYFSSPTQSIFVSVCIGTPGYRLMTVL